MPPKLTNSDEVDLQLWVVEMIVSAVCVIETNDISGIL